MRAAVHRRASDPENVRAPGDDESMNVAAVLVAVLMLAAGAVAGWALARARVAAAAASATAERDAALADGQRSRAERDAALAELDDARRAAASAQATLAAERVATADKLALLEAAETQLKDTFTALSHDALRKNQEQFLVLADSRFAQPLTETLGKVEQQMRSIEKERAGAQQALERQIEFVRRSGDDLRRETTALADALRKPQARGRWGELQLRRCVELAGMTARCDFTEQTTVATSDGVLRPDLVVRLVGGKSIVVDSKVTLAAYLEAHDATDATVRDERLAAHARHLRTHVDQLAAKSYWSQFSPAPEFVVLFVPGDAFLAAALDRDTTLLDDAFAKRVHVATPTTLISVLRTCAYAWQQEALAENAREVFDLGRELYKRLGTLGGHVDKLGRSLTRAVDDYNKTVGSLEGQVLVTARKLHELRVVDTELDELEGVEVAVRPLAKPELVAAAEQARAVVALPSVGGDPDFDNLSDYGLASPDPADDQASGTG